MAQPGLTASKAKSIGLTNKNVAFLDENSIVYACGNEIKIVNTNVGVEKVIGGKGLSINCWALDRAGKRLAYAEKGNAPRIFVVSIDNGALLSEIHGAAELEVSGLAFSSDGHRLAALSKVPDLVISVWESRGGEMFDELVRAHLPSFCDFVSFNPLDSNELCTTGSGTDGCLIGGDRSGGLDFSSLASAGTGTVAFWRIERMPDRSLRLNCITSDALVCPFSGHCWTATSGVWVGCGQGRAQFFRLPDPDEVHEDMDMFATRHVSPRDPSGTEGDVLSVAVTSNFLVVGGDDGMLRFFHPEGSPLSDDGDETFFGSSPVKTSVGSNGVVSIVFSPQYKKFCTVTRGGAIAVFAVPKSLNADRPDMELDRIFHREFHAGRVSGLATAEINTGSNKVWALLSCGVDGTLRVWDVLGPAVDCLVKKVDVNYNCDLVCAREFDTSLSAVASFTGISQGKPRTMVVVGDSKGVLRLLELTIAMEGGRIRPSLVLISRTRLYAGEISAVSFVASSMRVAGDSLVYVATSSKQDSRVYFVDVFGASGEGATTFRRQKGPGRVVGYISAPSNVSDLSVFSSPDSDDPPRIYIASGRHILTVSTPSQELVNNVSSDNLQLPLEPLSATAFESDYDNTAIAVFQSAASVTLQKEGVKSSVFFALQDDKVLRQMAVADEMKQRDRSRQRQRRGSIGAETNFAPLVDATSSLELQGHDKLAYCLALDSSKSIVVSGGNDGYVMFNQVEANGQDVSVKGGSVVCKYHDPFVGGISCLHCAPIFKGTPHARFVFCGARDGTVSMWKVAGLEGGTSEALLKDSSPTPFVASSSFGMGPVLVGASSKNDRTVDEPARMHFTSSEDEPGMESQEEPTFVERLEATKGVEQIDGEHNENGELRAKLEDLKERFQKVLLANDDVPDIEKLERMEFVIDTEAKEAYIKAGEEAVSETKEQIKWENLAKEYMTEKIRAECWDSMEAHEIKLVGFEKPVEVNTYPLHRTNPAEERRLEVVKKLRSMEVALNRAERKANLADEIGGNGFGLACLGLAGTPSDEFILNTMGKEKGEPKKAATTEKAAAATGEGGGEEGEEVEEEEENSTKDNLLKNLDIQNLLYHPFELTTRSRKIKQMHLLQGQIRELKVAFNAEAARVLDVKSSTIHKVDEKFGRIREIQLELGMDDEVEELGMAESEKAGGDLEVKDEEITAEKVLTEEERARVEAEEKERKAREEAQKGDKSIQRALNDMMGGTLEAKKEAGDGADELIRPEWMDMPVESMTDEQVKAVREFEAKLKALNEERDKQRKLLETELKKTRKEVKDICAGYDEKLQVLLDTKLKVEMAIYAHELFIATLGQILTQEALNERKERILSVSLEDLKFRSAKSTGDLRELKKVYEDARDHHAYVQQEDRAMDREFKREFADQDEFVDALYKLFKRRKFTRRESRKSIRSLDASPLDPFSGASSKEEEDNDGESMPDPVDPRAEIEGLEQGASDRLIEARDLKIAKEAEVRAAHAAMQEANKRYQSFMRQQEELQAKYDEAFRELSRFREARLRGWKNLPLLFELKQGQVEVKGSGVVTDLRDAVMVQRGVVTELNSGVVQLGNEKVDIMKETKTFRRDIHMVNWEIQGLELKADEVAQNTKYIQLLRVTKGLQELLKGGEDTRNAAEIALLEKEIEHGQRVHQYQVSEIRKALSRYNRLVKEKELENVKLDEYVADLDLSVSQRQKIHDVRQSAAEALGDKEQRMSELIIRKKLVESAKAQMDGIDLLRQELDRLRQHTFPSFTRHYRRGIGMPTSTFRT
uniref:Cilia- and flagella-associated protein 43 n=1 Tax=Palpitomonas bilix TaxID=652834 RepID=A0A7S3D8R0_9EUKA|mmetsp:Transcript_26335/g.67082  ORF Transcript_26335/g.67082 Transcript_26335/m.67082 type:complete len:1785 (+) Transcript_26335:69-5423(+)